MPATSSNWARFALLPGLLSAPTYAAGRRADFAVILTQCGGGEVLLSPTLIHSRGASHPSEVAGSVARAGGVFPVIAVPLDANGNLHTPAIVALPDATTRGDAPTVRGAALESRVAGVLTLRVAYDSALTWSAGNLSEPSALFPITSLIADPFVTILDTSCRPDSHVMM
jgi:hypothetical protein